MKENIKKQAIYVYFLRNYICMVVYFNYCPLAHFQTTINNNLTQSLKHTVITTVTGNCLLLIYTTIIDTYC